VLVTGVRSRGFEHALGGNIPVEEVNSVRSR